LTGAVDCFLPAVGRATGVSISQDATRIAWKDDQGVKVAGAPTTAADPCVFSSPPVIISATGSHPSIGGADIAGFLPAPTPPPPPATPPPAAANPQSLSVKLPAKLVAADLARAKGIQFTVLVPGAGRVTCTATVPASRVGRKGSKPVVVGGCAASAAKAGALTLRLRLNAVGRRAVKRLRGARLTLKITRGTKTITRVTTLR
jgi:hypothetical protein